MQAPNDLVVRILNVHIKHDDSRLERQLVIEVQAVSGPCRAGAPDSLPVDVNDGVTVGLEGKFAVADIDAVRMSGSSGRGK